MCKISLKAYEKLSSSSDKLRMRPDFYVKSAPHVFSPIKANHSHSGITSENEYKGPEHYTTTYHKTTQPNITDDTIGIWVYTMADFNLFYTKMAGGSNKMITYMSFKAFIEEQNEFTRCCEL